MGAERGSERRSRRAAHVPSIPSPAERPLTAAELSIARRWAEVHAARYRGRIPRDELVHDAVADVCLKRGQWRGGCSFSSWAWQTTRNAIVHRLEREHRRRARHTSLAAAAALGVAPPGGVELRGWSARMLGVLKPVERLVIEAAYWGGLSDCEIAAARGCQPTAVHKAHRRALARMRAAMEHGPQEAER